LLEIKSAASRGPVEVEATGAAASVIKAGAALEAAVKACNASEGSPTGEAAAGMASGATSPASARISLGNRQEAADHDQDRKTKGTPHSQTPSSRKKACDRRLRPSIAHFPSLLLKNVRPERFARAV
jgi:hypothetical protein